MSDQLLWYVHLWTISAAFGLLPGQMNSREARAMMLAIGLQESGFNARVQGGRGATVRGKGPARGFWQFERAGGVTEIMTAQDTKDIALPIVKMFLYPPTPQHVHEHIADHDVLAACFARLLLWRDPRTMPSPIEAEKGWEIYLDRWRPGKPHKQTWARHFAQAWQVVKGA